MPNGIVKLPSYAVMLIGMVAVPILDKIATQLEAQAAKTPETWDDVLSGAFRTVVDALKSGVLFEGKATK